MMITPIRILGNFTIDFRKITFIEISSFRINGHGFSIECVRQIEGFFFLCAAKRFFPQNLIICYFHRKSRNTTKETVDMLVIDVKMADIINRNGAICRSEDIFALHALNCYKYTWGIGFRIACMHLHIATHFPMNGSIKTKNG